MKRRGEKIGQPDWHGVDEEAIYLDEVEDEVDKIRGEKRGQPDWHGVDKEEIQDEIEKRVRLPHCQGNLKL